ncbi:alpha/beta fold hydrolase [Anaeromyxobacter paludicola]|uniref:Alpha/beta hydrolase n=1 Tax=Anaeromyxobacter paludicola TaxID=2918171 RepID=A0ABM7XAV3_9BACT|nr:alpha/beta hydrolase [Anaeromyxobacter paludicola]BDG08990.1 alpha/beta hydrolase [Anaeromyxobacter paludicola]
MLELLQKLLALGWRRDGATFRELDLEGARVGWAEFAPLDEGADRPTLVLLHGLGASGLSFYPLAPLLRRGYRVVVPDLPGCGVSTLPAGREYLTFAEQVRAAESFVDAVAPRGAYVAGNSMGGWMAAKLAVRRPDLVRGLALLNPGGPALRAEDWASFVALVAGEPSAMRQYFSRVFHRPPLGAQLLTRDFRRILTAPPVAQMLAHLEAEDFLSAEEVQRVRCPVALIWGEADGLIPEGCRAWFLEQLPGVRYEPVPDCGHCPQLECPGRTAELLLEMAGSEGPAQAA